MHTIYDQQREATLKQDRRFSVHNGHLAFEGVDLPALAVEYGSPLFVYSAPEIQRNIAEIQQAFAAHPDTKICYASKACSLISVLKVVKGTGISIEANSANEIRKCLDAGFVGGDIVYNGVVKSPEELEYAIGQDLFAINVDSAFELSLIDAISRRLQRTVRVCIRVEPNVKANTHEGLFTAYRAKSGIDMVDAEPVCREAMAMPFVTLCGLHMHVGDQVLDVAPFSAATKILVSEVRRLEESLGIKFELINVGGGIPTPYRYATDRGLGGPDNMQPQFGPREFAEAIISEVQAWRKDITLVIEPGRKVVGSAAVMLTRISGHKRKTLFRDDGSIEGYVNWIMVNAGFNVIPDYKDWYFYVYNASKISEAHSNQVKIAGPLCDGGDYFRHGPLGEMFLLPPSSTEGDIAVFFDVGAYQLENQTVYNAHSRSAAVLITGPGQARLARRADTYADLLSLEAGLYAD